MLGWTWLLASYVMNIFFLSCYWWNTSQNLLNCLYMGFNSSLSMFLFPTFCIMSNKNLSSERWCDVTVKLKWNFKKFNLTLTMTIFRLRSHCRKHASFAIKQKTPQRGTNKGLFYLIYWQLHTNLPVSSSSSSSSSSLLVCIFLFLPRRPFLGVGVPFSSPVASPVQLSAWRSMVFYGPDKQLSQLRHAT